MQQFARGDCGKPTAYDKQSENAAEPDGDAVSNGDPNGRRLVLLRWSPAALDIKPPVAFDAVANHFKELEQHLGLDLFEVHMWVATPEDVDRLRFLMRYQDVAFVKEALLDCIYAGLRGFEEVGQGKGRETTVPHDFPAAVLMLRNAMRADCFDCYRVKRQHEALRHVEQLLYEQVIGPMMNEAIRSDGITERAIGLAAAQLVEMFLIQGLAINTRVAKTLSQEETADVAALPLDEVRGLLGLGDRVAKFFRELDRCKRTTVNAIQLTSVPQPRSLALPSFD
jgi:hypothetical protein